MKSKMLLRLLWINLCVFLLSANASELEQQFTIPPDSAKPHTFWNWVSGNVSKEGITADLEAMKEAGLGGFRVFHVGADVPFGDVTYMSDKWHAMMQHTIKEAGRLGLQMGFNNCAGWSSSGGPWITPEYAMQKVVWTEKQVEGPADFSEKLQRPETKIDYYRDIAVLAFPTPKSEYIGNGFRISGQLIKTGSRGGEGLPKGLLEYDNRDVDKADLITKDSILILTTKMDSAGNLKWQVPKGKWTIVRFGYTPTGVKNIPAPPEGEGLECDKFSKAAVELQWKNTVQKVINDAGINRGKIFNTVLIDSYEVKYQNWTAKFPQEFKKRTNYDIVCYMPVLTGRVVESIDISERFLWDFRRVIADLFAENYYGHFANMCHKHGLMLSVEPYGDGNFDGFTVGPKADIPMGEFWAIVPQIDSADSSCKQASSTAHTYGRKYIDAESFTQSKLNAAFLNYPYILKSRGDYSYCQGINRFVLHTFPHQPWKNVLPGMTMIRYGTQFHRGNTWYGKISAWTQYMARCQYLLQEGKFVADLCYYAGEDAPNMLKWRTQIEPLPPAGYDYDFCTTENLMQMTVKDSIISLPGGMSYRILVLPNCNLRPVVLKQIQKLVKAGAVVYGRKSEKSPSLVNYPACDKAIKKIANKLWDRGKVIFGPSLGKVLLSEGVLPDFEISGGLTNKPTMYSETGIEYIHRTIDDADVYFISNQHMESQTVAAVFRVKRRTPELWHPDTGKIEEAASYSFTKDSRMSVPLSFDPSGSVFVVFRKPAGSEKNAVEPTKDETINIEGPWTLLFPKGWDAPERIQLDKLIDWTDSDNYNIQHFSGTATYIKDFNFTETGKQIFLDLGTVNILAEIKLNRENLGILWKPPFKVELTDIIKAGRNHLEIEVTNLWVNRLIGDEKYPDDCQWEKDKKSGWKLVQMPEWIEQGKPRPIAERKTFATWKWYEADSLLQPSGMLGPVRIIIKK